MRGSHWIYADVYCSCLGGLQTINWNVKSLGNFIKVVEIRLDGEGKLQRSLGSN